MQDVTIDQVLFIGLLVAIVAAVRVALIFRAEIHHAAGALVARLRQHYVTSQPVPDRRVLVPDGPGTALVSGGTGTRAASTASRDDIILAVAMLYPDKSANEIAAFFGGKRVDVLALVKAARGGVELEGAINPISGRPTTAQFDDLPAAPKARTRRLSVDEETGALIYTD